MKKLIVIAGPTASGKTELAIQLANHLGTEIISCDSRQCFKEMQIGTAKPSEEELLRARHHFISTHSVKELFTAGDFEREGLKLLDDLFQKYDTVVMAGGSGLYVRALCHGLDFFPDLNPLVRENLKNELQDNGLEPLIDELKRVDPEYYQTVDVNNAQRVLRGLEVFRGTGKKISCFRKNQSKNRPFKIVKLGVQLPREELYKRINYRVDVMLEQGLLNEVKALEHLKELNALQTVGYKEFFDYLEGKSTLEEAVELVKRNTRRYAKRQITWFKKEEGLTWLEEPTLDKVLAHLQG